MSFLPPWTQFSDLKFDKLSQPELYLPAGSWHLVTGPPWETTIQYRVAWSSHRRPRENFQILHPEVETLAPGLARGLQCCRVWPGIVMDDYMWVARSSDRKGKNCSKPHGCESSERKLSPSSSLDVSSLTRKLLIISKKHFRQGGMAPSEWTHSSRAVRDTPVAVDSVPGITTTSRIAYRPPIAVSPFLLALSVYTKYTLYLYHVLISLALSMISWIYSIAWIVAAG